MLTTLSHLHTHWACAATEHSHTHSSRPRSFFPTGCFLMLHPTGKPAMSSASNEAGQQSSKISLVVGYLGLIGLILEAPTGKTENWVCVYVFEREYLVVCLGAYICVQKIAYFRLTAPCFFLIFLFLPPPTEKGRWPVLSGLA